MVNLVGGIHHVKTVLKTPLPANSGCGAGFFIYHIFFNSSNNAALCSLLRVLHTSSIFRCSSFRAIIKNGDLLSPKDGKIHVVSFNIGLYVGGSPGGHFEGAAANSILEFMQNEGYEIIDIKFNNCTTLSGECFYAFVVYK